MTGHGSKFGRKMEEAIAVLLTQRNVEEAARATGISTKTLLRWLQNPEFKAAYRDARRTAFGQATARLQQGSSAAVAGCSRCWSTRRHRHLPECALRTASWITQRRPSNWRTSRREWRNWKQRPARKIDEEKQNDKGLEEEAMKALTRRVPRLEVGIIDARNENGQTMAEVVRERRRLRLQAAGIAFNEHPGRALHLGRSLAETIRLGRRRLSCV